MRMDTIAAMHPGELAPGPEARRQSHGPPGSLASRADYEHGGEVVRVCCTTLTPPHSIQRLL